ncbi:MAG: alpha-galactosidase [Deltaproteobacteria bacterium]|nr:alpha-galactosidase [Deltaproteobacteria bacterium]
MTTRAWAARIGVAVLAACGEAGGGAAGEVRIAAEGDVVTLSNTAIRLEIDLATGTFRVATAGGAPLLDRAESRAVIRAGDEDVTHGTSDPGTSTWTSRPVEDALGKGRSMVVTRAPAGAGPALVATFDLREGATWLTASVEARWGAVPPASTRVVRLSPVVADTRTAGALFVGPDPATHRVLDNGHDVYFDFVAEVLPVGSGGTLLFPPGYASNWNVAIHDPASRRGFVAGFLSSDRGVGVLGLDFDPAVARTEAGRAGFTRFDGISFYMDAGRLPIADGAGGAALVSERLYLDFLPASAHDGLEAFARRYAQRIGKQVRADVPTGWNSWGGGSGSGGYGTNIDEALILANLARAKEDFLPWGMKHFLVDDGWQDRKGDWRTNRERFPDHDGVEGMKWLAAHIRDQGMIPGIWISPFEIDRDSDVAKAHPDWWADVGPFGLTFVPKDAHIPDLSRPEVLDWIAGLLRKVTQDWGYRWIKMDFSYFALFATGLADPGQTPSEAFRNALLRIREAIGPDTFYLMVSATGITFEVADSNRITLDNEPWWGEPEAIGDQGIKATYKTVSRRWYLGHNLWVNHPDLIYFRPDHGLTFAEARAWASVVPLCGGIVKLGESYLAMHEHPEWLDAVRRLLPVHPRSGRPLDVFDREYAETWDLPIEREGRAWHVIGMFHWGRNRDVGGAWEEEAPRAIGVDLARIGLDPAARHLVFDAWDHAWTWHAGARLERTLQPRTAQVLVVRPAPAEPAVVATSRHLLGGAVEVSAESWDPATGTLTATISAPAGRPVTVWAADAGRTLSKAEPGEGGQKDGLAWTTFTPSGSDTVARLAFARDGL